MGKAKRKTQQPSDFTDAKRQNAPLMDATPERFAHAHKLAQAHGAKVAHTTLTAVDMTGRTGQKLGKARRFTPRLDLLHSVGAISPAEWIAGVWWRDLAEVAYGSPRLCGDYGQSVGGGSRDPSPLPISERAEIARRKLDGAKRVLTLQECAAVEDILDDPQEQLTGRASMARMGWWRSGLKALAAYVGGGA